MPYSKCFFFVLFLTTFGNANAQQIAFVSKQPSLAIFNIEGTEKTIQFNSKTAKTFEPIKSDSYNIVIVNKDSSKVFITLYRNGQFVNRIEEKGKIIYSIVSLTPTSTIDIQVQKL